MAVGLVVVLVLVLLMQQPSSATRRRASGPGSYDQAVRDTALYLPPSPADAEAGSEVRRVCQSGVDQARRYASSSGDPRAKAAVQFESTLDHAGGGDHATDVCVFTAKTGEAIGSGVVSLGKGLVAEVGSWF